MKMENRRKNFEWILPVLGLMLSLMISTVYQPLVTASDLKTYSPPRQLVNVGDHRLHIHCLGKGSPTVVMEAGMSGWSADWILLQPEIAKTTRVCTYDRAGYGWSDTGPRPRDSQQVSSELQTLLLRTGIQKYILVGHSLGGLFVQMHAKLYPKEIAGMVLVDSVHPEQSLRMKQDVREKYEGDLTALTTLTSFLAPSGLLRLTNQPETTITQKLPREDQAMTRAMGLQSKGYCALADEMASFAESQLEVRNAGPLPNVPLTVLSSSLLRDFPPGFSGESIKGLWDELQVDLARQQPNAIHLIAKTSGHYIHLDQPDLVINAVTNMVKKLRK